MEGLCQLLLDIPYRNASTVIVPLELKNQLIVLFEEKFTQKDKISWQKFNENWSNQFNDDQPPRRQTINGFFYEKERDTCEYWLIDGLCQLLLNCSFEDWINPKLENNAPIIPLVFPSLEGNETRWVGRDRLVNTLKHKLLDPDQNCRMVAIVGLTGIGKTALATRLLVDDDLRQIYPAFHTISFDCDEPNFDLITKALLGEQALLSQSANQNNPNNSLLNNEQDIIATLLALLRSRSCLVILDMIEESLSYDHQGNCYFKDQRLQTFFEQVLKTEKLASRIIITSQDQLPVFAAGRYSHRYHQEILKGLNVQEAIAFFEQWEICARDSEELDYLQRIISVYEGHPLALRVIAGEMRTAPYYGEIKAYWHEYGEEIEQVEQLPTFPNYSFYENLGIWGYYLEQIELGEKLINKISDEVDCLCLFEIGNAYYNLGQFKKSLNYYQKLLDLAIQINNQTAICQAYGGIGNIYLQQSKLKTAIKYFHQQSKLSRKMNLVTEECKALDALVHCYRLTGQRKKSLFFLNEVCLKVKQIDDPKTRAFINGAIGSAFGFLKDYRKATIYLQNSFQLSEKINFNRVKIKSLSSLGVYQVMSSIEPAEGIELMYQALEVARDRKNLYEEMAILNHLAVIYCWKLKNLEKSITFLEKALTISEYLEDYIVQAHIQVQLAFYHRCLKNERLASQYEDRAFESANKAESKACFALVFAMKANTHWVKGRYLKAMFWLIRSLIILPPWQDTNGHFIWQRFIELLEQKFPFLQPILRKCV